MKNNNKNKNKNTLDRLYDLYQEHLDYTTDESKIIRAKEQIAETVKSAEKYEDIECAVLDYGIAYERAGFRNGFIIATRILCECINTDHCIIRDIPENPFES